jgi:aspartyl-tRNA(Asn)/glutamyl-tRNA(Gln) amidotransferase subunit A
MRDITSTSACDLTALIKRKVLSPVDVVEAFLDQTARLNSRLNAFSEVYVDDARRAAVSACLAVKAGSLLGPLHGVPIAVKDSMAIAGKCTTAGSAHLQSNLALRSANIVKRLEECGAIIIGKTHMVEFGLGAMGVNEHFGTPWNPWDAVNHCVPGGSSSGAAVAVATRLVPWALGTDTGGSARIPAAWCGITGMKPTCEYFDMKGIVPLSPTLDVVGPICSNAEDLAYLFGALTNIALAPRDPLETDRDLRSYRLGVLVRKELDGVDDEILAAYDEALSTFAALGASLVPLVLPYSLQEYRARTSAITFREAHDLYGELARNPEVRMDEAVRQRLLRAAQHTAADYVATLQARASLQREFSIALAGVDALLTPTTQNVAPLIADVAVTDAPNMFTRFVNLLDLCAVSVPNGFTKQGLPIGLQIVCDRRRDAVVLKLAIEYQRCTDWHMREPPVSDFKGRWLAT